MRKLRKDASCSNEQAIAALNSANTVKTAAQAIGVTDWALINRARHHHDVAAAMAACRSRYLAKQPSYSARRVELALKAELSTGDAASSLGVTSVTLRNWVRRCPSTLLPLYNKCKKRAAANRPRPFRSIYGPEKIKAALRDSPSLVAACAKVGMPANSIHTLIRRNPEIAALAKVCSARGRAQVAQALTKGRATQGALPPGHKAEFCFADYVGKFATLAKPLPRSNVTYLKGVRVKTIKRYHKSFSIVLVDDAGNEIEANNAWGRYFIAGVTRRYLAFEAPSV